MNFKSFYNYDIYEDGRIYSHYRNRFLEIQPDSFGYRVGTFYIEGKVKKIKIHRLVAKLFLGEAPKGKPLINHIDGNKLNNHVSNLEWCTYSENNGHARKMGLNNVSDSNRKRYSDPAYRKKQGEKISKSLLERGVTKGENNGRFRYRIFDTNGKMYSRNELANLISRSQSNTDAWIKKAANGDVPQIFLDFGITVKDTKSKSQSTIESI